MKQSKVADMTTGSPFWHLLKFSIPLILGNIFQQFYNMVDSVVVGNYVGANALAAVGNCSSLNFLFFALSSGLAMGIGIIVAQYFGAKQYDRVSATIANSFYVLISAALIVSMTGFLLAPNIISWLSTPEEIAADSIIYMRTTCVGITGIALYNGIAAILRALGDSKTPLYFLIVSSITNVCLDMLFVVGFGWGVFGVALATILSQALSAVCCLSYAIWKVPFFRLTKEQLKPHKEIIFTSYKLGVPVSLQSAMIALSFVGLQSIVNSFGPTVMAAFTITNRVEQLVNQPYSSLAQALTTYSGQNIGAGKPERVKKGFWQAMAMIAVFSAIMAPIAYFFGENIVSIFVKERDVIEMGGKSMKITSLAYFFLGTIYVPRGILNGCGDTGFALINGITEVVFRVGLSQILTRFPAIGYWGVWLTTGFTWTATGIVCLIRYAGGKWKLKGITGKTPTSDDELESVG